ncbi:hypothetical protein BCON_0106g00200 [Botryotinia convoluta]|uniref:Increased loss of mitochondrial DNA protein 1 n=1 Tax=Botryotinia convoluta TaxID=54673 RepID=A0A4Z1ICH5_9HELO|nr:hypothetical protein BCON_0106g00200 [Botryotinia convoluta]
MGIISGATIITSLSLLHITLAFFFITNPVTIAEQSLVFILGESMGLPYERSFDRQSAPISFLGIVFLFLGITDLVAISMPEEVSQYHWGTQAPIRFSFSAALALYSWLFSSASPIFTSRNSYHAGGWGEGLKNRIVFTWGFIEMMAWFWVFVTLREERQQLALKQAQKKAAEEDMM